MATDGGIMLVANFYCGEALIKYPIFRVQVGCCCKLIFISMFPSTEPMGLNPMAPIAPMNQTPSLLSGGGLLSPTDTNQPAMQMNNEAPAPLSMTGTNSDIAH